MSCESGRGIRPGIAHWRKQDHSSPPRCRHTLKRPSDAWDHGRPPHDRAIIDKQRECPPEPGNPGGLNATRPRRSTSCPLRSHPRGEAPRLRTAVERLRPQRRRRVVAATRRPRARSEVGKLKGPHRAKQKRPRHQLPMSRWRAGVAALRGSRHAATADRVARPPKSILSGRAATSTMRLQALAESSPVSVTVGGRSAITEAG